MSYKSDRLAECQTETERLYEVVVTSDGGHPLERWVYASRAEAHLTAQLRRTEWAREGSLVKVEVRELMTAHLDGLQVTLFRSDFDGKIVVDIETHDLKERDVHPGDAVPDIRVAVNGYSSSILPDGSWSVDEPL